MAEDARDALIAELRATLSEERKTRKREAEIADRLQESVAALHGELAALRAELGNAKGPEPEHLPLFSELSPEFEAEKMKELPNNTYSRYAVPAALAAWLEICGDRPLLDYRPKDLSEFARVLARVPSNKAKQRRFADLSYREAAEANAGLRKPGPTLSVTSIRRQYVGPVQQAFAWLCAEHRVESPLAGAKVAEPRDVRPAEDRAPLTASQIAAVLREALERVRPDDRWLPVLGFLTGCRISELVYLQGRDPKWNRAAQAWIFDLRGALVDGHEVRRPLKNSGASKRIIALPSILDEIGFVAWARERRGWLFDQLHRTRNPGKTASKRMARLLEKAGVRGAIRKKGRGTHALAYAEV